MLNLIIIWINYSLKQYKNKLIKDLIIQLYKGKIFNQSTYKRNINVYKLQNPCLQNNGYALFVLVVAFLTENVLAPHETSEFH